MTCKDCKFFDQECNETCLEPDHAICKDFLDGKPVDTDCPRCGGSGGGEGPNRCPSCRGTGTAPVKAEADRDEKEKP